MSALIELFVCPLQDDIVASEPAMYAMLGQVYIPTYMSLVDILLQKAQYPPDAEYDTWNAGKRPGHHNNNIYCAVN